MVAVAMVTADVTTMDVAANKLRLPQSFVEMIENYKSPVLDGLIQTLTSTEPAVSLRLNRRKTDDVNLSRLDGMNRVPWASRGYYLSRRPRFTLDPTFHQGRYYVQDASSMFVEQTIATAVDIIGNESVIFLDACAAPGGKTTAAVDTLPAGSIVIANEYVPSRASVLVENLTKWGYADVIVTRDDTARLGNVLAGMVDIILADVPCSGEGMMRKDNEAVAQWTPRLVDNVAKLQLEIVDNLWNALRPGGCLIYSTCTFNRQENEENLMAIIERHGAIPVPVDISSWPQIAGGIDTEIPCCRFIPGRVDGEGLFMTILKKPDGDICPDKKQKKNKTARIAPPKLNLSQCHRWINCNFELTVNGDTVSAVSPELKKISMRLQANKINVIKEGVDIATVKGRDLIPTQALAMSTALNRDFFPRVDVDRETALDYLSRDAISLPEGTPRGFVLLYYDNYPLGFVKNIGNRANNLYPAAWRILHR